MKTTNYEISKKLKEAGFEAETNFFWCRLDKDLIRIHISQSHSVPESLDKIKAYDLDTILDALKQPDKRIIIVIKSDYCEIGFGHHFDKCSKENESFADTAGRLWLMLKEKGVIC